MNVLLQVQINIVSSILTTIILGHAYFNMNRKKTRNRIFLWILGLTLLTLVLETFSILLDGPAMKPYIVLHKLVNILGFSIAPVIPFLGYIFSKEWVNRYQKEKIKSNYFLLLLPLVINLVGTLLSYKGSGLFHITGTNNYERGLLFFILPTISYMYFSYNLYFIYKLRQKFSSAELVIFSTFYIVPAISTYVQLEYAAYLTIWNSLAIILVFAYIFIQNEQAYRDNLTGLENRLSYEHYAQNINKKRLRKLFIVYLDLDEFKMINDQFGHLEGDEAIKIFADLIVESFRVKHKRLIRLGGDEFLILLNAQQQEQVEVYIQQLIQQVEMYNTRALKPYQLKFSFGLAGYTKAVDCIHQILETADQAMYAQKQSRKG
ncbi:GGDEF domain-containing protein [Paenibacillus sp. 19GGS1-52]|uniref:GGDEF domain-containing protein n=1 Tax=Paenibacillus sp. 19GGS1-52 TaxID=2758563 RepID=UPI001EFB398F|nr:GGDEF domain-containing protein [Paenibacillus sp. 19GGS1-52]ULO05827.1 GGDEF domain-containing protein [Paenibacillus sp. 19GGS1-52]